MNRYIEPFAWIAFGGLIVWGLQFASTKKTEKSEAVLARADSRMQASADAVKAGPQTTTWETAEGTLIEVAIPKARRSGRFVDMKRCIVWRDMVTSTSSLHCERDEVARPSDYPSDPPDRGE